MNTVKLLSIGLFFNLALVSRIHAAPEEDPGRYRVAQTAGTVTDQDPQGIEHAKQEEETKQENEVQIQPMKRWIQFDK